MKWMERTAAVVLALLSAGHGIGGTLLASPWTETATLWSFSGSLAAWLIAALAWLSADRPSDRGVAAVTAIAVLAWTGLMVWLMEIDAMWADPRPWAFIVVGVVILAFTGPRALRR